MKVVRWCEDIVVAASLRSGRTTIMQHDGHRLAGGMRWIVALISIVVMAGPVPARAQVNFDRPGGDYTNFDL